MFVMFLIFNFLKSSKAIDIIIIFDKISKDSIIEGITLLFVLCGPNHDGIIHCFIRKTFKFIDLVIHIDPETRSHVFWCFIWQFVSKLLQIYIKVHYTIYIYIEKLNITIYMCYASKISYHIPINC